MYAYCLVKLLGTGRRKEKGKRNMIKKQYVMNANLVFEGEE